MGIGGSFPRVKVGGGREADHSHLFPRSRMRGAIPSLPNTPSLCGAQFKKKAQEQLYIGYRMDWRN